MRSNKPKADRRSSPAPQPPAGRGGSPGSRASRRASRLCAPRPARLTAALLVAALGAPVFAQRLDLGPSTAAPKPGDGLAVLALADLLEKEAGRWEDDDARHAIRVLAGACLRNGEIAGAPGSESVLAGLTLAAKRDQLDGLLDGADDATHLAVVGVIGSTDHSVAPRALDLLLRDALAPLNADADPRCGWWSQRDAEPATEAALDARLGMLRPLLELAALTDGAEASLREFLELAETSRAEPAYRRAAIGWADLVLGASAVLGDPPAWLDMPARDRLRDDFCAGVARLLADPDGARRTLDRAGRVLRVVAATEYLPADLQSRELRDAVNRLAAAPEGDARRDPAATARIADAYAQALELIAAEARAPRPEQLVRQARPMLEPLAALHRQAAGAMTALLPGILASPDPMTDPAILAAMGSLRGASADLAIAADLSAVLAGWDEDATRPSPSPAREPAATRLMGPLAERVRQLGVRLGQDKGAAEALEQLRTLRDISRTARDLPGERELRADAGSIAWRRVTGDQASRLLFLVDQAREGWLRSVAADQLADRRAGDEARLRTLAAVLPLLRDAATIEQMRTDWARKIPPAGNQHPAWELTREGLAALAGDLPERAARLAAITARADSDAAALGAAHDLERDFAAALLVARIERELRDQSLPGCGPVAELASGATDEHAWRSAQRSTLAAVCRAGYEAAAADGERREALLRWANSLASGID
ncbi:MAG: hypothetical protein IT431_08930 [Phycisphaerales bacterium]|nr:hypothetical protein [Phycisphaerales bacterium]